jgi:hypothetical protein
MNLRLPILAVFLLCAGIAQAQTNPVLNSFSIAGALVGRVIDGINTNAVLPDVTRTLAYHLSTNAVARTSGFTNALSAMQFLEPGPPCGFDQYGICYQAKLSTNCWLAGVQGLSATCLGDCVTNASDDGTWHITMISPRHYLCASHVTWSHLFLGISSTVFVDTNGVVYIRRSLQITNLPNSDTTVGILDADLPASVGFLPLLPINYTNWLDPGQTVQGIGANQDSLVFGVGVIFGSMFGVEFRGDLPAASGVGTNWTSCADPLANCYGRSGDSSTPIRLLVGNQLVLVSAYTTGISGPDYALQSATINAAMHQLSTNNSAGTDYQLSFAALTNWPALR